ncbi:MAG TPA: penicillin acylase family protein [Gemmatimonadaceae bacterium]|nr:penicillin acylase family protein [Gemmatimonadaceae bacterium]
MSRAPVSRAPRPAPPSSMRPSPLAAALAAVLLALGLYAGARRVGPLPPLGPLLDPANGAWALAATAELPREERADIPGLGASVRVIYDDRAVPHIFAATESDAWRALGWVVARDRLAQMEIQTLAASGRLTEIAGARALSADREMRGLGLPRAAERKLAALDTSGPGARAVRAYADGVSAYIASLRPRDWPLELRLLGRRPSRWEPINSIHLINRMGWTLAYGDDELRHAWAERRVGRAAADALYPVDSPIQEPIQPNGERGPRLDLVRLPAPGSEEARGAGSGERETSALLPASRSPFPLPPDALGSNNWAVAPRRSASGHALLAGDPHLELTLPSIWYEAHVVVPGVLDVYGVTIPGAPGIIMGFNRDVAWTFTNTQSDVADWYAETVDDESHPTRYRLDGAWRPLELRVERYRGPRGETVAVDTMRYTHRGPLVRTDGRWVSLRWTVLESSGASEADALIRMERARSVEEYRRATEGWAAPAQNMLVADRAGSIAIRSTGRFPIRPGDGRGDLLRDGSRSEEDWTGSWPLAEYPQAVNPAQGFLASANQQPVDPRVDPRYIGTNWVAPWRAVRINELLRADSAVTPDDMRRWQTDPLSPRERIFRHAFLDAARARPGDSTLARAASLLSQWDGRYTKENDRAVLFELAMDELRRRLWDELRGPPGGEHVAYPGDGVVVELLRDSESAWWDDRATRARETRDDILAASLRDALALAIREHGPPDGGGWRWERVRHDNINHILRIPALSARDIPVQGGPSLLNPSSGSGVHGASWRMVVELGPEMRAWGTYPGGQSGNPASSRYTDRLAKWSAGTLDTLRFPRAAAELSTRATSTLTLAPARP